MQIEDSIREMEGKISLLDNRKFIRWASILGVYYLAFLGFLAHDILSNGGF